MGNIIISTTLKSENPEAHRCQHPFLLDCFISSAFCKHSLSLLASPARISRQRQTRRPRLLFSFSAKCLHQRQQQQEEEEEAAVAAGGGGSSSNSSRRQQQQQQQQGAASKQQASSKQAASKQKAATSVCPVERIMKYNISSINQRNTKIELFPGARPPDTTSTS